MKRLELAFLDNFFQPLIEAWKVEKDQLYCFYRSMFSYFWCTVQGTKLTNVDEFWDSVVKSGYYYFQNLPRFCYRNRYLPRYYIFLLYLPIFNYFLTKGQEKIGYHYTLENNSPPLYLMCLPGSWCLKSLEMPKLSKKLLFFKNEDNLRALVMWKFAKIREVVNYRQSFKNCFEMNMWFHSEKLNFCAIL